jgi:hypothetical protein
MIKQRFLAIASMVAMLSLLLAPGSNGATSDRC